MIILFSKKEDLSTFDIVKWLHHMGVNDVIRINAGDNDAVINLQEGEFYIQLKKQSIRLKDIKAVWYRKGRQWLYKQHQHVAIDEHPLFTEYLNAKIEKEEHKLSEYFHYMIENTISTLGSSFKSDLNKLKVLSIAKSVGLLIPDFYVVNSKKSLEKLFEEHDGFITKSMSDGIYLFESKELETGYFSYTEKITREMIEELPDKLPFSFLQKKIYKDFEIRIFFLDGCCYSMAILSQLDEQTQTDFRKYNEVKPNRMVPFMLPEAIDKKIIRLFDKLDMRTGSVDFIVDKKGDYYFLEINPVGQFSMTSAPCNYNLEKKVALTLIEDARRTLRA